MTANTRCAMRTTACKTSWAHLRFPTCHPFAAHCMKLMAHHCQMPDGQPGVRPIGWTAGFRRAPTVREPSIPWCVSTARRARGAGCVRRVDGDVINMMSCDRSGQTSDGTGSCPSMCSCPSHLCGACSWTVRGGLEVSLSKTRPRGFVPPFGSEGSHMSIVVQKDTVSLSPPPPIVRQETIFSKRWAMCLFGP